MAKEQKSYRELHAELQALLDDLQTADVDVDEAITKYQKAEALIKQLEERLQTADLTIKKLKSSKVG